MGIFKKHFGPLDPTNRPKEWFYSEDGRKSFDFYVSLYNSESNQKEIERLVEEKKFHILLGNTYQARWPFTFICCFLEQYIGKNFDELGPYASGVAIYFMMRLAETGDGEGLTYKELLNEEKNFFLKFLKKFNFYTTSKQKKSTPIERRMYVPVFVMQYVLTAMVHDLDVTDEKWIYDESTYVGKKPERNLSLEETAYIITVKAAHPEFLTSDIKDRARGIDPYDKLKLDEML